MSSAISIPPFVRRRVSLAAASAMASMAACFSAFAAELPPRQAGLWEMTISEVGGEAPAKVMHQCLDAATDKALRNMGQGAGGNACAKQDLRKDGATMVLDSVCQIGNTTATSHAVFSGDFKSSYRVESQASYKPPLAGKAASTSVIEAKWQGACKGDQKPGDIIMPNGMKMNVLNMAGAARKKNQAR